MADAAERLMSNEEFLVWAETQDEPYELVDGVPVPLWPRDPAEPTMMAPPSVGHQQVQLNTLGVLRDRLRPPCWAITGVGVPVRQRRTRVPDVLVTCVPVESKSNRIDAPTLLVEVLSPSNEGYDRSVKLDEYKQLESVREIWLVASDRRWAQLWRRVADTWHGLDVIGRGGFESPEIGSRVELDEIYLGVSL